MVEEPEDNPYTRDPDLDFMDLKEMSEAEAEEEAEKLREAVEYHDHRYYVENDPVISDGAYDTLFGRLEDLEEEFNLPVENSPTQRVGGEPLDSFETREHVSEMLSLDSSEEEEEVRDFDDRVRRETGNVEYSAEPKFDGFSVELVYLDGDFDRAVTRGDGVRGDDITKNVRTIRTVPLKLPGGPDRLAVRGEVYMPKPGFQQLNEKRVRKGEEPFANPRNAAAGTIRQLDPSVVAERPLDIYFYGVMESSREIGSQEEAYDLMESLGLKTTDLRSVVPDIDSFVEYRDEMLGRREGLECDIDGVIAKVNDGEKRERMGKTARHPRWAYAYKFPPKTGRTSVEKITVQVGRTGKLTPVALLDPVDIKGVTVSRATVHNEEIARKLGIGEGAGVRVERAGDVIPEIEEVVEPGPGEFEMPEMCPVCGSEVVKEGEYHFCSGGLSCRAQLIRSLEHFCSKPAMDIEGVGGKIARQLVEEGLVSSVADLYGLEKEDILGLERFAGRSADNLLAEIEKSREADLASFISALGIPHVGEEMARTLAKHFPLEELEDADREELEEVEDIGPEVSDSIRSFFHNERNLETLHRLKEAMESFERKEGGEEFEGLKMVITGKVEGYTRREIKDVMERYGASVASSVSGETDYLVVGENPGSTKLEEAEDLNTETLEADEFKTEFLEKVS